MKNHEDAIEMLKADHAAVKKLFKTTDQSIAHAGKEKIAIFAQIKATLEVHATIEEEIFYPVVKQARSEHVKDEVREGYEEHKQIKTLLAALSAISPTDESYNTKLKVLKEDVEHHVKDEEGEMFPDAKKYLAKGAWRLWERKWMRASSSLRTGICQRPPLRFEMKETPRNKAACD